METTLSSAQNIQIEFSRVFKPLLSISAPEQVLQLFREIGYELKDVTHLLDSVEQLADGLPSTDLIRTILQCENNIENVKNIALLIKAIKTSITEIIKIKDTLETLFNVALSQDDIQNIQQAPKRLLDYLIIDYLKKWHSKLYYFFRLFGIIIDRNVPICTEINEQEENSISIESISWKSLPSILRNPLSLFEETYNWKHDKEFDHIRFFENLKNFFASYSLFGGLYTSDNEAQSKLLKTDSSLTDNPEDELRMPISYGGRWPETYWEIGVSLSVVPTNSVSKIPKGLAIIPYLTGDLSSGEKDGYITLVSHKTEFIEFLLKLKAELNIEDGLGIIIRPPHHFNFFNNLFNSESLDDSIEFGTIVEIKQPDNKKLILLGNHNGSNLGVSGSSIRLILEKNTYGVMLGWKVQISRAQLVISASESDGFITRLLPAKPLSLEFDLTLGMSLEKGFYITGAAGLSHTFNINKSLGPVYIESVNLELGISESGINLAPSLSASAKLGPLQIAVKNIGLISGIDFTKKGSLGNADFSMDFKPPSGLGVSIDASMVKGGGFLDIDRGNYYGIINFCVKDKFSITAIGILITRTEQNEKTFALKFLGMAEFPAVQIGFGFSISGLGMALGVNCMMNIEALRNAAYNGSLQSLLFPPDPIANALQIFRDLDAFMPRCENAYVIGAMAKIGWGAGDPVIKADVGIFIEFGSTFKIVLAGIAKALLPNEDKPQIVIKIQVLGIIDFDKKQLAIDASLNGSRIKKWRIDGDLALRSNWGDNPRFGLSIGGFFPGFKPPADFPVMKRLSLSLGSNNPRIGLFFYMAITENSLQFGAALIFHWERKFSLIGLLEIDGRIGFDALIIYSPFQFETRIYGEFCLKRNSKVLMGIGLDLYLKGPNKFHAKGKAYISFLFFDFDVNFEVTWGDKSSEFLGFTNPLQILASEISNPLNWSFEEDSSHVNGVVYRNNNGIETLAENFGFICFNQRQIPLQTEIQKCGNTKLSGSLNWFDITHGVENEKSIEGYFAPGEFEDLSSNEKITATPFEKFKSGTRFKKNIYELPYKSFNNKSELCIEEREVGYELRYIKQDNNQNKFVLRYDRTAIIKDNEQIRKAAIRIGRIKYTNKAMFLKNSEETKSYWVSEQKFALASNEYKSNNGFKRMKESSTSSPTTHTHLEMRNRLRRKSNNHSLGQIMAFEKTFE